MSEVNWLYFDVETERSAAEVGGWHNIEQLGVACVVTLSSGDDTFQVFRKNELNALFDQMKTARSLVGFNSIGFDVRVLQPFADIELRKLPHLDLMLELKSVAGFRPGLNNCCQATFGECKSSHGLEALAWWREGREDEVIEYCKQDVALTRRLHEWGAEHGWVKCLDRARQPRTLRVNWSLEAATAPPVQGSLF